jgi:hypothetical protein
MDFGSVTMARSFILPLPVGHSRTSMRKHLLRSSAQGLYRLPVLEGAEVSLAGASGGLGTRRGSSRIDSRYSSEEPLEADTFLGGASAGRKAHTAWEGASVYVADARRRRIEGMADLFDCTLLIFSDKQDVAMLVRSENRSKRGTHTTG